MSSMGPDRLASPLSLAIIISTMMTIYQLAPSSARTNSRAFSNSVPGFVEALKDKYPELFSSLSAIPGMAGSAARASFLHSFDNLTAVFGGSGGAAEVFLVAVVVWIFLSTKSSKAAYLNLVLKMYLWLPAEALPRLRLAMGNTSHWVNLLAASDTWTTLSVYSAPGYIRLNPSSVGTSDAAALACAQSWHELFNVLLSAIASSSGGPVRPSGPPIRGPADLKGQFVSKPS